MTEVFVTNEDMENGNPTSIDKCAVALAMQRAKGTAASVIVVVGTCKINGIEKRLPESVSDKIMQICRYKTGFGDKPKPFKFKI